MSQSSPIPLGWKNTKKDYSIVQGNSGLITHSVIALRSDSTPYPSYIGFTSRFSLYTLGGTLILSLSSNTGSISYTHSPTTNTLTFNISITSLNSYSLPADEDLIGDLMVTDPSNVETQYPLTCKIKVFRSFSRTPTEE